MRFFYIVLTSYFLYLSLFGAGATMAHDHLSGNFGVCPFTGLQFCDMNLINHLLGFKQAFLANASLRSIVGILIFITIVLILSLNYRAFFCKIFSRRYFKNINKSIPLNELLIFFIKGILHPKIY